MAADPQSKLNDLRKEIDAVDDRLAELLVQRLRAAKEIGALKQRLGQDIIDSGREAKIIQRLQEKFGQKLGSENVNDLFESIFRISRDVQ